MDPMSYESASERAVLVFDGDCGFCTTAVSWLERLLPAMPEAAPYQWADLEGYGLSLEDARAKVWLVHRGRRHGGAAAVAALLRHQPSIGLRFLGWLGTVWPWSAAAAVAYRLVAQYRFRLPGGTPACRVPNTP
jgi:predicted DCC family thiol-disulfide oxidoreductase YuxK